MSAAKMTEREYMERVAGLFEKVKAEAATEDETVLLERYREAEFDLTVDYRLGVDFPQERREALRKIQRQSRDHTEAIKAEFLFGKLTNEEFAARMQAATAAMIEACRSVLTPAELEALVGSEEGDLHLPLSPDAL